MVVPLQIDTFKGKTVLTPFRDDEDDLPLSTLAHRIEVNPSTLHRWRLQDRLKMTRLGGRWRVERAEWERFMDRCNATGVADPSEGPRPRTPSQRRRDDARAAAECEVLGV